MAFKRTKTPHFVPSRGSLNLLPQLIKKQRDFFNKGVTREFEWRRDQLKKLREVLLTNDHLIYDAIYRDLRRPADQTKYMEFDRIIMEIDYALEHLKNWMRPERKHDEPYGVPFIYKDPLGCTLIISPFNFPAVLALRPLVNSISAGNTVILKPSEVASNTANALSRIFKSFDEEFIAVVEGDAQATISLLNNRFDHIFYTGSPLIAKSIMAQAAVHLTPTTMELGGKCPAVVLEDCDLDRAVQSIVHGKFANVGQLCMATDYCLVEKKIFPQFVEKLKKLVVEKYGSKPKESSAYTRIINGRHFSRLQDLIDRTKGRLVYKPEDENDPTDLYIGPHLFEVDSTDVLMKDELFGPILPLITVDNLDFAINFINVREKPLNAYVFTKDEQKIERFLTSTYSANAVANGVVLNYYSMQLPFSGVGYSGNGQKYHGKFGFETFSHQKAVVKAKY
ncbi:Aldehyde dehydrogenase [Aphelenchoides besseyi]|nr:Aldehyde dehydrogenase [Aphelenchoides besseyi]